MFALNEWIMAPAQHRPKHTHTQTLLPDYTHALVGLPRGPGDVMAALRWAAPASGLEAGTARGALQRPQVRRQRKALPQRH